MDNQDNLFNKIKSAAENAETKEFPSMEKVWSRIDAKLDTKVQKKQNSTWKKLAVAASILLVFTFLFQFLKQDSKTNENTKTVVVADTIKLSEPQLQKEQNAIATTDNPNPIIKKEANAILNKQIEAQSDAVALEEGSKKNADGIGEVQSGSYFKEKQAAPIASSNGYINIKTTSKTSGWMVESKNAARSVVSSNQAESADKAEEVITVKKEEQPLVVIDNELRKDGYKSLNDDEIESLVELPNPVYYINNVEYTEEELYGKNPTSPYAPLSKQKIETITILQPEKAVTIYGKKGENGVVIITTKDGKPKAKK